MARPACIHAVICREPMTAGRVSRRVLCVIKYAQGLWSVRDPQGWHHTFWTQQEALDFVNREPTAQHPKLFS